MTPAKYEWRLALKRETIAAYGGKCARCGYNEDIRALCLDHINDDASLEKEYYDSTSRFGGIGLYSKLRQQGYPKDRFQLLCYNCNAIKHSEFHEHHRGKIKRGFQASTHHRGSSLV